ncbi:conserved hypothetical protein, partial [Ricinus communis]
RPDQFCGLHLPGPGHEEAPGRAGAPGPAIGAGAARTGMVSAGAVGRRNRLQAGTGLGRHRLDRPDVRGRRPAGAAAFVAAEGGGDPGGRRADLRAVPRLFLIGRSEPPTHGDLDRAGLAIDHRGGRHRRRDRAAAGRVDLVEKIAHGQRQGQVAAGRLDGEARAGDGERLLHAVAVVGALDIAHRPALEEVAPKGPAAQPVAVD